MRVGLLVLGLTLTASPALSADKQVRPFVGVTFGGSTTFVDLEDAVGHPKVILGVGGVWLGDLIGLDVDVARAGGFFQVGDVHLVLRSSVTTVTGNLVVTLPRRLTEYSFRPYFVGGAGLMRVQIDDVFEVLPVATTLAAFDVGGGATGFVTNRVGVCWDVRRFLSIRRKAQGRGLSLGPEGLSFWRASMALAIRWY